MNDYKNKGHLTDIQVHLTNNCNYNCSHCYTNSNIDSITKLSSKLFEKIIIFANKNEKSVIRIMGGEVVTHSLNLNEYLNLTSEYDISTIISTNGHNTNMWGDLINPNIFREIILSVYGFHSVHDKITGVKNSFSKVLKTIKLLSFFPNKQFELTVNTLITHDNYKDSIKLLKFLSNEGVDEVKILTLSPLGRAVGNYNQIRTSDEVIGRMIEAIIVAVGDGNFGNTKIVIENSPVIEKKKIIECKLDLESMITIDPSGNIYPCHLMIYNNKFIIGNLNKDSLDTIINNYLYRGGGSILKNQLSEKYIGCPAYCKKMSLIYTHENNDFVCPLYLQLINNEKN